MFGRLGNETGNRKEIWSKWKIMNELRTKNRRKQKKTE